MNKITFPLKQGDKGSSVVNLQDALLMMLDRKAITPANPRLLAVWKRGLSSDRSNQTYGNTTTAIVKKYQEDRHFRPDGIVGRQTAAAINKLLTEWRLHEHPTEPEAPAYKVQGHIKQADGSPLVGNLVRALDKDLRHEQLLGEARTDRQGYYTISYNQNQFRRAEKQQADLLVQVYNAEGSLLAESDIIFNAQAEETVDLILDSLEPEKSEYKRLLAEVSPLLEGVKIDQLIPEDIVFLSGETGLESSLIADLVSAAKLAVITRLPESAHYGLIREHLPVDLDSLFRQGREAQQRALEAAVKNKRIPELSSEEQEKILDRLHELLVESMIDDPEDPTKPTIGRVLATTLLPLSRAQKKAFAKLHLEAERKDDLWEKLKQHPEFRQTELVDDLKVTVQIGNLTQNHVPLIRSVQKMRQEGRIKTFRELARLTVKDWAGMIKKSVEEQGQFVPPTITGDTDAEKIDNYARQISERLENLFPTLSIAYRLEQDDLPDKQDLSVFFDRSIVSRENLHPDIPEFDFATTHIDRYLDDYAGSIITEEMNRDALSLQLKTLQRLFRVSPYYAELRPLLLDGLHSAQSIVRMGPQQFVKKYAGNLGGETRAAELYDKAEHQNAMATALLVSYSPAYHGATPEVVPAAPQPSNNDLAIIPDWPSLFGSLDFCACKHCQSVYSPAAYLVDVLHYLKDACPSKTLNKTAKDVLFERRGDIGKIELSCANTNTPVPYIDLVNEILENAVAKPPVGTPYPQTRDSAEEIGANPEHVNPEAYKELSKQVFPWSLPFDLWAEECRVYLQQLGTTRHEIMEVFSDQRRAECLIDSGIAREYMGLSSLEWGIVTGFDSSLFGHGISLHQIWEYWGYPKFPEPAGWLEEVSYVPTFLKKSGLSHPELVMLLATRFVNPNPAHRLLNISPTDACRLEDMSLGPQNNFTADKLNVIHRFIRLQRKLGWTVLELDQAFTALQPKDKFGKTAPTSSFLVQLSHTERLCKLLKLPVIKLLSFWSDIDTTRYEAEDQRPLPSLYDKLFQNKTLLGGNKEYLEAFALHKLSTASFSEHGSVLLAVLGIGEADLKLLQGQFELPEQLSLASLSILYRHVLLAKALKLKIPELLALKVLMGIDPFAPAHTENALLFVETLQKLRETDFSVAELNYFYCHIDNPEKPIAPSVKDLFQLAQTLLNEFKRIDEATRVDVATEDVFRTHLATVLDESQVSEALDFLNTCPIDNAKNRDTIDRYFGLFLPETPGYSELLVPSVVEDESEKQAQKEKAIGYLSTTLMPFLRSQQSRAAIKQILSETFKLDKLVTESLLEKLLRSQRDPSSPDLSAIDDFVGLENAGLIASYKGEDAQGNFLTVPQTDPCIDFDWGKASPAEGIGPGSLMGVTWVGKLLAPSSESYIFHLDAAGDAELLIDNQTIVTKSSGAQPSQPISFTTGDVYEFTLTYTPSDSGTETPRIKLSWSSPSTAEAVIAQNWFYPENSYENFTDSYTRLWKAALLVSRFTLTVKEIDYWSQHSADFDGFDLNDLPIVPPDSAQTTPKLFAIWERLYAFTTLRDSLPVNEAGLTDVFALAANNSVDPATTKEKLAEATGWDIDELVDLKLLDLTTTDIKNEIRLFKLRDQLALCYRLGIALEDLNDWRTFPSDPADAQKQAQTIKNGLKSRYEDEQWLEVAKPIKNKLREQQRSALVAYLLANPKKLHLTSLKDSNDLYDQLLIDVEMSACQMTSRIKQANSSLQLFVQRCLMGLEPDVKLDKIAADQWKWMKNYRVWEANRKVFLYPENWIEPELRDDKSPFFKEMENDLLQGEINMENVETAFRNYLEKLDDVALLDVRGMYWQLEKGVNILHVFARTRGGAPFTYYYRQWVDGAYWTPWEKVNVDIQGDHLVPVVYNRRLRLYWPIFEEKPQENVDTGSDQPPKLHWEIKLAWSEYKSGKWSAKKISEGFIKSIDRDESDHRSNYANDQYFFLPVVLQPDFDAFLILCFEKPQNIVANYSVTKVPSPTGEFKDGQWNWLFRDTETALGSFDIVGCHDTIYYYDLHKHFTGQTFYFSYPQIILDNNLPEQAFMDPNRIDEWNAVQKTKWWYDYALPDLVRESSYQNEMVVEWPDRIVYGEDDLFINPALKRLTKFTPGQFSLLFLNQYGSTAKSVDCWIDTARKEGGYSLKERKELLPFHYSDDTKAFFVSPKIIESLGLPMAMMGNKGALLYKFQTCYHPYSCRFISELNRYGIDGLLDPADKNSDLRRQFCHNLFFPNQYQPTDSIGKPYPIEWIDFMPGGAYSLYNWELFFHAPLMIADRLMNEQRFEEAQKWFHYIFDPTIDDDPFDVPVLYQKIQKFLEDILGLTGIDYEADATARRYWKIQPFFLNCLDQVSIQQLMGIIANAEEMPKNGIFRSQLETMVDQWRKDPFKPHLIARLRISAYQKTVVMKYLDNLIAWADNLFRRDTMESINEATQLYILAARILGPRPAEIQPRKSLPVKTYNNLEPNLDAFSNAIVETENHLYSSMIVKNDTLPNFNKKETLLPELQTSGWSSVTATLTSPSLYFCIPHNEDMLEYWDTISDRLFKVRHCMNIEGMVRQLPLFEPPINPALLVKAAAAGLDIGSVLQDLYAPMPKYRFQVMLQKALELCAEVKALGSALLSTLEKKDAEALSMLRTNNEIDLLKAATQIKEKQIEEADESIAALTESKSLATARKKHYSGLLSGMTEDIIGLPLNLWEATGLGLQSVALISETMATLLDLAAAVAHSAPDASVGSCGMGPCAYVTIGGSSAGMAIAVSSESLKGAASALNMGANLSNSMGRFVRRKEEWELQLTLAEKEETQIQKQMDTAKIRKEITEKELDHHNKQIEKNESVQTFMQDKFTNQELYSWMSSQISGIYFQSYKLAYDIAKQAEKTFRFELGLDNSDYIQFGYWDSLNKGLLAGEKLFHDLKRMEVAYLEKNKRDYEISKHISLLRIDPIAFISLKEIGQCIIKLPEWLFDMDYPGHYFRRIKSVSLTIPCITGPYTSVNCTLTLLGNEIRISNNAQSDYPRDTDPENDDPRFFINYAAMQSIATSTAQNDSGLFELNFRDERYLPFEGAGAISRWRIDMPQDSNAFDFDTVSDVIINLSYTAREGGEMLKCTAKSNLDIIVNDSKNVLLKRFFSARHEFPNAWHQFLHPESDVGDQTLVLKLNKNRFPFMFHRKVIIQKIEIFIKTNTAEEIKNLNIKLLNEEDEIINTELNTGPNFPKLVKFEEQANLLRIQAVNTGEASLDLDNGEIVWDLSLWLQQGETHNQLEKDSIKDIFIVCHYRVEEMK